MHGQNHIKLLILSCYKAWEFILRYVLSLSQLSQRLCTLYVNFDNLRRTRPKFPRITGSRTTWMAPGETFSLALACVVWVHCSTYLYCVLIHNISQRSRLKVSTVVPDRHVWVKRYTLQPSSVPKKKTTLTTLHRLGRNETSNNRDSNYRDSTVFFQYLNINRIQQRVLHYLNCRNCYDFKFNWPASFQGQRKWSSVES
jgi:hypothetical protein